MMDQVSSSGHDAKNILSDRYRSTGTSGSPSGVVRGYIFCGITSCSPLKINQDFGEVYRLLLQGEAINLHKLRVVLPVIANILKDLY